MPGAIRAGWEFCHVRRVALEFDETFEERASFRVLSLVTRGDQLRREIPPAKCQLDAPAVTDS